MKKKIDTDSAVKKGLDKTLDPRVQKASLRLMAECSRKEISSGQAKEKLLKILSTSRRAEPESCRMLSAETEENTEKVVLQIIEKLKQDKYIDDARFAKAFTRDKLRFSKWGPEKILKGLSDAGVEKSIAEEAVEAEEDLAVEVLAKLLSVKRKELEKKQEKKAAELLSKLEALQSQQEDEHYNVENMNFRGNNAKTDIVKERYRQKASLQRKIYELKMKLRSGPLQIKQALVVFARTKGFPSRLIEKVDCEL